QRFRQPRHPFQKQPQLENRGYSAKGFFKRKDNIAAILFNRVCLHNHQISQGDRFFYFIKCVSHHNQQIIVLKQNHLNKP
ncbi:hypothetical protein ACQWFR_25610, partial [Salmonella enterica subsp. enterica serovar Infantis]